MCDLEKSACEVVRWSPVLAVSVVAYNSSAVQLYMAVLMPTVLCRALRMAWHRTKCCGVAVKGLSALAQVLQCTAHDVLETMAEAVACAKGEVHGLGVRHHVRHSSAKGGREPRRIIESMSRRRREREWGETERHTAGAAFSRHSKDR